MKISKEARRLARRLFRECFANSRLDEARVRTVFSAVSTNKPRHYLGILEVFGKLVQYEIQKNSLWIESAIDLGESQLHKIKSMIQVRLGETFAVHHKVNPALIGGLRIKIGSDVWDGSVAAKLQQLASSHKAQ